MHVKKPPVRLVLVESAAKPKEPAPLSAARILVSPKKSTPVRAAKVGTGATPCPKASGGVKKVTSPARKKRSSEEADAARGIYVVERILEDRVVGHSCVGGRPIKEFRIRWAGYDSSHDSWEPEKNLSRGLLKKYTDKTKQAASPKKRPAPKKLAPAKENAVPASAKQPAPAAAKTPATSAKAAAAKAAKPTTKVVSLVRPARKPAPANPRLPSRPPRRAAATKVAGAAKPAEKKKLSVVKTSIIKAKKVPAKKVPAKKVPAKKAPTKKLAPDEFVVEAILDHRSATSAGASKQAQEYLIRWAGYDSSHDSWEPAKNVSRGLIKDYISAHAAMHKE